MKNLNKNEDELVDFIDLLRPPKALKSKDQVWDELVQITDQPLPKKAKVVRIISRQWSIAASIALLVSLGILAFLRFYTVSISSEPGEQKTATLPDGSMVYLNAQTLISYQPFWWKINRSVNLNGEGFFKVKKGERFTVISNKGITTVLGTSFNIYARENDYEVTCLTGKVSIASLITKDQIIIIPNQMVNLNQNGKLQSKLNVNANEAIDWTASKFVFTQAPLNRVLAEIGRRYGVEIKNTQSFNQLYTGSFNQQNDIEAILALVCKPFDIEFKKLASKEFIVQ
jgi:transmembrane sensor